MQNSATIKSSYHSSLQVLFNHYIFIQYLQRNANIWYSYKEKYLTPRPVTLGPHQGYNPRTHKISTLQPPYSPQTYDKTLMHM